MHAGIAPGASRDLLVSRIREVSSVGAVRAFARKFVPWITVPRYVYGTIDVVKQTRR